MQLRFFIYTIFILVLGFILNIVFYFFSADYREFLRELKDDNRVETLKDQENKPIIINKSIAEIKNSSNTIKEISENEKSNNVYVKKEDNVIRNESNVLEKNKKENELKVEYKSSIDNIKETKIEKEFLNRFKEYRLKKLELHPRLFDLTTEYPDEYIEYYSEYLTIYFFGNKPYEDLKDIFQVLTYELPFTINEVNNFGDKSFYINLEPEFQDGQVRIVLSYKNRTFGLKVSKDVYPLVKDKLKRLK